MNSASSFHSRRVIHHTWRAFDNRQIIVDRTATAFCHAGMGLPEAWSGTVRRGAAIALDAVLPPRCLACGAGVDAPRSLCASCWSTLTFVDGPCCARCGLPFELDVGEEALCGGCIAAPPSFARARSALRYDDASRKLILAFKHGDRLEGVRLFGRWLAQAGAKLTSDADLIAPVPLHRWRLFLRLYNQSAVLARALGEAAGKPVVPDLLSRVRWTPSQAGRNARQRRANVRRAFVVPEARRASVEGARILLIDDVFTTGATVDACAETLLEHGARAIDVLTLARVVRPQPVDL